MAKSSVRIYDNNVDITKSVDWTSIDMTQVLTKEVGTLKFNVRQGIGQTSPAKTIPQIGDTIELYDSSGIIFGGTVTEYEPIVSGLRMLWQITCTDWGFLLDGTLVKKNYTAIDPADIVTDIINTFCSGKGFNLGGVVRGNFLVATIQFNYQQPSKALQSLAKLIGWDWFVGPDKTVYFFPGAVDDGNGSVSIGDGGQAPITVDDTGGEIQWNSLDVQLNLTNMQNSVYVIGGNYIRTFTASNTQDVYLTDGVRQQFPVSYEYFSPTSTDPYEAPIRVTLDGSPLTVGTYNQMAPATVDVLYFAQQRWILFTGGAPAAGQTVRIYGGAMVPIVAHAADQASVSAYGERQIAVVDTKIKSVLEAQARAKAQVLQFGHPVYDVKFKTNIAGCQIGQAIKVNLPSFGIDRTLVIKRVEATGFAPGDDTLGIDGQLEYQVECIGSDKVTFVDLMTSVLQQEAAQTPLDSSTMIEELLSVPETPKVNDTMAIAHESRPYTWG